MRHLTLIEGAPPTPWDLSTDMAQALSTLELAVVTRTPGSTSWDLAAGSKVGVARVGDLQVTVRPKVPVDRVVFMMGYAQKPKFWRDHNVLLDVELEFADALAESFRRLATRALEQGLLQGYRSVDDTLPVVRGRIRVGDQLSRRFGLGIPLEIRYDEFTADIAENQLLLAAATRLLRMPTVTPAIRQSLQRLRLQLADVTPLVRGLPTPDWAPSRLNTRYQPALHLAELILAGESFEQRVGDIRVSGFVFDMWRIYENFVCVALREAMAPYGGRSSLQHHMHLDESGDVAMQPDYVWIRGGEPAAVADAKYKAEKPSGFPQADLYQLLAYCTVLGLKEGHLVYAKGNEDAREHSVIGADVTIHCHTLDLAQQPEVLLGQVGTLASRIARTPLGTVRGRQPADSVL
jgi:5-methylcytosine-specific restriction enzyme subunit McrC